MKLSPPAGMRRNVFWTSGYIDQCFEENRQELDDAAETLRRYSEEMHDSSLYGEDFFDAVDSAVSSIEGDKPWFEAAYSLHSVFKAIRAELAKHSDDVVIADAAEIEQGFVNFALSKLLGTSNVPSELLAVVDTNKLMKQPVLEYGATLNEVYILGRKYVLADRTKLPAELLCGVKEDNQ